MNRILYNVWSLMKDYLITDIELEEGKVLAITNDLEGLQAFIKDFKIEHSKVWFYPNRIEVRQKDFILIYKPNS